MSTVSVSASPLPRANARSTAIAALLAFLLALGVYATRAAPSVLPGDSAEMQTLGLAGGVAHQTGYPMFILSGYLFRHLPFPDMAYRITFMASFFGAAAVAMMVVLLVETGLPALTAFAAAVTFGGLYTVFSVGLRAEVYTQALFLMLLGFWLTFRALRSGRDRDLLLAGLGLGLCAAGHLSHALTIGALGLMLAWRAFRKRGLRSVPMLFALVGVFLLGLTPYLYLIWADAHYLPMDYMRSLDEMTDPLGPITPSLHNPWVRLWQFERGVGPNPPIPAEMHPYSLAAKLFGSIRVLLFYELGPIGALLALAGIARGLGRRGSRAGLLLALAIGSVVFTVLLAPSVMLDLFLLGCLLCVTPLLAWGYEAVLDPIRRLRAGPALSAAACLILPVLVLVSAHGTRHFVDSLKMRHVSLIIDAESYLNTPTFFPSLRGMTEDREYGEQVLAALPRGTLTLGTWGEIETMRCLQIGEGKRPDLVILPGVYPYALKGIERWQRTHSLAREPICFLARAPEFAPHFTALDSLRLPMGRWIYLVRQPMKDLDRPVPGPQPVSPR